MKNKIINDGVQMVLKEKINLLLEKNIRSRDKKV